MPDIVWNSLSYSYRATTHNYCFVVDTASRYTTALLSNVFLNNKP